MIIFTNEKNEKRDVVADWGMVEDTTKSEPYSYILRYTTTPIDVRKLDIIGFLQSDVKVSCISNKLAKVTCIFGKPVMSGIEAKFIINEIKPKVEPKVDIKPEQKNSKPEYKVNKAPTPKAEPERKVNKYDI